MNKNTVKTKSGLIKYLLFLPLLLLSFCQSEFDESINSAEDNPALNAKVLSLMKAAIQSDTDKSLTQNKSVLSKSTVNDDSDQCTYFKYPMTFEVYYGDDPTPQTKEINSDEELIAFLEPFTLENDLGAYTPDYEVFIDFPIILLDTEGQETELNSLTELEGTLQMAVMACDGFKDESEGDTVDGSEGNSGDGSEGDSGDESEGDSVDGSESDSSDESEGDSVDGSEGGSNDSSTEVSEGNSNDDDNGFKYCDKNNKKAYICHKGITICVSVNAIWGHLEHHEEDFLGTCDD